MSADAGKPVSRGDLGEIYLNRGKTPLCPMRVVFCLVCCRPCLFVVLGWTRGRFDVVLEGGRRRGGGRGVVILFMF